MQQAGSAFDGVSFHCYQGYVGEQASFTSQYPDKVYHFMVFDLHVSQRVFRKYTSRSALDRLVPTGGVTSKYVSTKVLTKTM